MLKGLQERLDEDDSFTLALIMGSLAFLSPTPTVGWIFAVGIIFVAVRRSYESKLHFL